MATDKQLRDSGPHRAAPYIGFRTFLDLVLYLNGAGCPEQMDHAVKSGQVLTAFRFLGLIDSARRPTEELRRLVAAYRTPEWPVLLQQLLHRAYAPIFQRDLASIESNDFRASFRAAYPAAEEVSRKSIAFFLHATREAGIVVNQPVTINLKPRLAPAKPKEVKPLLLSAHVRSSVALDVQSKPHLFIELFNRDDLPAAGRRAFDYLLGYLQTQAKTRNRE